MISSTTKFYFIYVLFTIGLSAGAFADDRPVKKPSSSKKKSAVTSHSDSKLKKEGNELEIKFSDPQNGKQFSKMTQISELDFVVDTEEGTIELSASSYLPQSIDTGSTIANAPSFGRSSVPSLQLITAQPVSTFWNYELGLSWVQVQRTDTRSSAGVNFSQDQNAHVFSFVTGAEFFPFEKKRQVLLSPYLAGQVSPTIITSTNSTFGSGSSTYGVLYSAGAGTLVQLSRNWKIDLGISQTVGAFFSGNTKMNAFAAHAGIRAALHF